MRPLTPLTSPPALPTKTRPCQAIGAAGTDSPFLGSAMVVAQRRFARLEVIGEHAAVLRPAKQLAIHIGGAAVDALRRGRRVILVHAPVLPASGGIDREDIVFGDRDERARHLEQPRGEAGILPRVIGAQHREAADIAPVDLAQIREPVRGQRLVVARPIAGIGARRRRSRARRRRRHGCRRLFRRQRPRRRREVPHIIDRQRRDRHGLVPVEPDNSADDHPARDDHAQKDINDPHPSLPILLMARLKNDPRAPSSLMKDAPIIRECHNLPLSAPLGRRGWVRWGW